MFAQHYIKIIEICHNYTKYKKLEYFWWNLRLTLNNQIEIKGEHFSNGRMVRNIYDKLVMNHAKRVAKIENPSCDILSAIIDEDFIDN